MTMHPDTWRLVNCIIPYYDGAYVAYAKMRIATYVDFEHELDVDEVWRMEHVPYMRKDEVVHSGDQLVAY